MSVHSEEIAKFSQLAAEWWDPDGPSRALHDLNPARLAYVESYTTLASARVLDAGCGGGILSEALARAQAQVTGVDAAGELIEVAREHATATQLAIDYQHQMLETFASDNVGRFDVVTCMEMIEHVEQPQALIHDLARLLKPGGQLFLSTLNRSLASWTSAILGAEYMLGLLPKGTHEYEKFIRPQELAGWLRSAGFQLHDISGLGYNPLSRTAHISNRPRVNYLVHAERNI